MKNFWEENTIEKKQLNKKKIIILLTILILIILITIFYLIYANNESFRNWTDINIFRKEINQEKLVSISLNEDDTPTVYAFNQNIGILNNNEFKIYNSTGKEEKSLTIEITKPIIDSNNRYLVIAENKGKKIYLIKDKEIAWEKEIQGDISGVEVNQNGYVAITVVNTSNKTVVEMYDETGNGLFYTYYATTRVGDIDISDDNKYLAVAEIDTSGTSIKSNIQIISIEAASSDPDNSIVKKFEGENNELLTNLNFQSKNYLVCMYTNKINLITPEWNVETITESTKEMVFADINLKNNIATLKEESTGLFTANTVVTITNIENKNQTTYKTDSVIKEIYASSDILGLNLGTEIEFINTSGWLVKRYIANQEITQVSLSNSLVAIVYRDKVEILNL